jgi:predicted O-linked N-acetylglucosamine transferase (SPINDLY family)
MKTPTSKLSKAVELYRKGRLKEALIQGKRLASGYSEDPVIHNFVGVISSSLGHTEAAAASLERAIALNPGYAEAHRNLGVASQNLGKKQKAVKHYSTAVKLDPRDATAQYGLASALKELGRMEQAISSYTKAIQLRPGYAAAYNNLGNLLEYVGRDREAIIYLGKSVEMDADSAEAQYNLGHLYNKRRQLKEAISHYELALQSKPNFDDALAKILHLQSHLCDWNAVQSRAGSIPFLGVAEETVAPFSMLALDDNPAQHLLRTKLYARQRFRNIEPLPASTRPAKKPKRIHIGYFSSDFYNHATLYLMIKLFELHDRSKFVIHAYSYSPDKNDEMSTRLRDAVDVFHDVRNMGERAIAELSRSDEIDIAIDLKGYTMNGRAGIFAHRAAPIQINYLGYPGTMGFPAMDYIIADNTLVPENQRTHYTENIIYLPDSYQVNDDTRKISSRVFSRADAGLPDTGFVYCCFNNNYKITAREFDIWMRLLSQVKDSVLWLICTNDYSGENFRREAAYRGINPQRIILAEKMPLPEHLARLRLADLFLDTFNCNAHTTASDALWAGLPVLTKLGESFAARVAGSLLNALKLPELITDSERDYEYLALDLAQNPKKLALIKGKLQEKRQTEALFDTKLFTEYIEAAYLQAYQRYFEGKEPETLIVES